MTPANPPDPRGLLGDLTGRTARLMFYTLLAITLMALDHRGKYVDQAHRVAAGLTEPLLLAVEAPVSLGRRIAEEASARRELAREVASLEQALQIRDARLSRMQDVVDENEELRRLLGAGRRLEAEYLPAELVSVDLDPFAHRVVVRRGRLDGVEPGMPVLDAGGVLGQVESVGRHTARVILITDPDHALPIRVQRTGARTIAYGSGSADTLRLDDLPMNTDLEAEDLLVTSGLGGGFPPGLPVARVQSVDRSPGRTFASARAQPVAFMDRGRHVLIVATRDAAGPVPAAPEAGAADAPSEDAESATESRDAATGEPPPETGP